MTTQPHFETVNPEKLSEQECDIATLEDEIRVDRLCRGLLRALFNELSKQPGLKPEIVGRYCHGADYFLRDFIIADRRQNLLQVTGTQVRQFAAHWYIVKSLEPNMSELTGILNGIAAFYWFLADHARIPREQAESICAACAERDYFQQRIDDFWSIEGDGFIAWRNAEPL